jgi:hypothetical protein
MFKCRRVALIGFILVSAGLSACGTFVPGLQEIYDIEDTSRMIDAIVSHVQCEVQSGIQFLILDDIDAASAALSLTGKIQERRLKFLEDWAAQATLTLTVDEKTTLSPGLSLNQVFPNAITTFSNGNVTTAQSFSLGLGATASADATRKETVSWLIDFRRFMNKRSLLRARKERDRVYAAARTAGAHTISICNDGPLIEGDLKLREWLYAVLLPAFVQGGIVSDYRAALENEAKLTKKDVISHQITFAILYSGNVTPTWKLVRVSANQGSLPLFNAQRGRTQDLTISMGPAPAGSPSVGVQNATLASQIGIAVANAIKSTQP